MHNGVTFHPGQGNNAYIFPGVGLGALVIRAKRVTDSMFHRAALTLAEAVPDDMLSRGSVFPSLEDLKAVSLEIAVSVAREAYRLGIATVPEPADLKQTIREYTWQPEYRPLI